MNILIPRRKGDKKPNPPAASSSEKSPSSFPSKSSSSSTSQQQQHLTDLAVAKMPSTFQGNENTDVHDRRSATNKIGVISTLEEIGTTKENKQYQQEEKQKSLDVKEVSSHDSNGSISGGAQHNKVNITDNQSTESTTSYNSDHDENRSQSLESESEDSSSSSSSSEEEDERDMYHTNADSRKKVKTNTSNNNNNINSNNGGNGSNSTNTTTTTNNNHTSSIFQRKLDRSLLERDILQSLGSNDDAIDTEGLSDYELLRLRNIQRNEARMKELGLMSGFGSATTSTSGKGNRKSGGKRGDKNEKYVSNNEGKGNGRGGDLASSSFGEGSNATNKISSSHYGGSLSGNNITSNSNSNNNNHQNKASASKSQKTPSSRSQLALYYKQSPTPKKAPIHKQWLQRYEDLKSFQMQFGHIHIPLAKKSPNDGSGNNNDNGNGTRNSQYKSLRTWLMKQKRQYVLFKEGGKSTMDDEKASLMEKLGGRDWWVTVKNSGEMMFDSGKKRGEGKKRNHWSEDDYDDDEDFEEDEEGDGEWNKRMMQDLENDDDDDDDEADFYVEDYGKNDWSSSSYVNDDGEEEDDVEIGSVDSLAQESIEEFRQRKGSGGYRHRDHDEVDASSHSSEERVPKGGRRSKRTRGRENARFQRRSQARYESSSGEEDDGYYDSRRQRMGGKNQQLRANDQYYSDEEINASSDRDFDRKASKGRVLERYTDADSRESDRKRKHSKLSPPRKRKSVSQTRSSPKKRSLLEQIPGSEDEYEGRYSSGRTSSSRTESRRYGSSKRRRTQNSREEIREEVYYSEDEEYRGFDERKRRSHYDSRASFHRFDRDNHSHDFRRGSSPNQRRYHYDDEHDAPYVNYRDDHRHRPDISSSPRDRRRHTYDQKPMDEIVLAPNNELSQTNRSNNRGMPEDLVAKKNALLTEYGQLYSKRCLILQQKAELAIELRALQSLISAGGGLSVASQSTSIGLLGSSASGAATLG